MSVQHLESCWSLFLLVLVPLHCNSPVKRRCQNDISFQKLVKITSKFKKRLKPWARSSCRYIGNHLQVLFYNRGNYNDVIKVYQWRLMLLVAEDTLHKPLKNAGRIVMPKRHSVLLKQTKGSTKRCLWPHWPYCLGRLGSKPSPHACPHIPPINSILCPSFSKSWDSSCL